MGLRLERRFERYCDGIVSALAHADREQPARWYLKGLMLPGLPAAGRCSAVNPHRSQRAVFAWPARSPEHSACFPTVGERERGS